MQSAKVYWTRESNRIIDYDGKYMKDLSLRDEFRFFSRHIRDCLVPFLRLDGPSAFSQRGVSWMSAVLNRCETVDVGHIDLLRYSRIEKALMDIVDMGAPKWPVESVTRAEAIITKWEDRLGPLKMVRADLYGVGGSLEGVSKLPCISSGEAENDGKSTWTVTKRGHDRYKSHQFGHITFRVGDWWLKPIAAHRDGIIDVRLDSITANSQAAYAIIVSANQEFDLEENGDFIYRVHSSVAGVFEMCRTMTTDTPKVVRVLRSHKLHSRLKPKAGIRYDGLYRIIQTGYEADGNDCLETINYIARFTLQRLTDQAPMTYAQLYPVSHQMDDWYDYQQFKSIDRDEKFAVLRELLGNANNNTEKVLRIAERERLDSGYFSRRGSAFSSSSVDSSAYKGTYTEIDELPYVYLEEEVSAGPSDDADDGLFAKSIEWVPRKQSGQLQGSMKL